MFMRDESLIVRVGSKLLVLYGFVFSFADILDCIFIISGSPMKMASLPGVNVARGSLDDPRPLKYRNRPGKMDHIRNTMVNYCANTSHSLSIRYAFPSAGKMTDVLHDHDYLSLLPVQSMIWIDSAIVFIRGTTNAFSICIADTLASS